MGVESGLQSQITSEVSRAQTAEAKALSDAKAYTDTAVAGTVQKSYVDAADTALSNRIAPFESRSLYNSGIALNDTAAVYADGQQGTEDPSTLPRDGWYYKNSTAGKGINWYFFDKTATKSNILQSDFNAYAVMTLDQVSTAGSKPILAIYSYPTGSNDAIAGFCHSKWVYQLSATNMGTLVAGKKYLFYTGVNPSIHPEIPHIMLDYIPGSSVGSRLASEVIGFAAIISDPASTVNSVQWMVESLGASSPSFSNEVKLRIRFAQKANLDAEITRATASENAIFANVTSETNARVAAISAEQTARIAGDASTLTSAKAYTDTAVAGTVQKSYVDAQDAATLASGKSYSDGILVSAKSYSDSANAATLASSKGYTDSAINALVNGAPQALDTLKELADQLGRDESAASALTLALSNEVTRASAAEAKALVDAKEYTDSATANLAAKSYVDDAVNAEQIRAQGQENLIANNLNTEIGRAETAEQALSDRIGSMESLVWDHSFKASLEQSDITNQYYELNYSIVPGSSMVMFDHTPMYEGVDYSIVEVSGKSRVMFMGDLVIGGQSEISVGDDIYVKFQRK